MILGLIFHEYFIECLHNNRNWKYIVIESIAFLDDGVVNRRDRWK